ncbi:MAG: alkaline phosphatase, partial [Marinicellaceae bacterium]
MKLKVLLLLVLNMSINACAQVSEKADLIAKDDNLKQDSQYTSAQVQTRGKPAPSKESPNWWYQQGAGKVYQLAKGNPFPKKAKNVILIVGDGMNISTITAARILAGQKQGGSGEEFELSFEKFPQTALSKTYSLDYQVSSSAATMTAMMTGVKTKDSLISVNGNGIKDNCDSQKGNEVITLLELAEQASMSTGVVTTARLTHATPAATYAHSVSRYWEADEDIAIAQRDKGCKDIAQQLVEFPYGDGLEVALGGGRRNFLPNTKIDPEYSDKKGERLDGRDLTKEWLKKYKDSAAVWNLEQFENIDAKNTKHLLGLFEPKHMHYEHDRPNDKSGEPSLSQMTQKALDILKQQNKPYFLMIESGRIDHGHHDGNAYRALSETVELNKSVNTVLENVDLKDTLIIV